MRVKLLLGALLICGLLAVPASVEAGHGCGSGLFNGDGLFNGGGCNILSRLRSGRRLRMARRVGRHSERVTRVEERSVLIIDGKRPCADGKCNSPEVASEPDTNDGALLEVQPRGGLSDIVSVDVGALDSGSLLDFDSSLLGGEGVSLHIPSPGSILSDIGLGGLLR